MTSNTTFPEEPQHTPEMSAGQLLHEARVARGIELGMLASVLKVSAHKLQLLETDQYEQLPDMHFTRSLAIAICKRLEIDDALVLKALPLPQKTQVKPAGPQEAGRLAPTMFKTGYRRKKKRWCWWPVLVILALALGFLYFMPERNRSSWREAYSEPSMQQGAGVTSVAMPVGQSGVETQVLVGNAPVLDQGQGDTSALNGASTTQQNDSLTVTTLPVTSSSSASNEVQQNAGTPRVEAENVASVANAQTPAAPVVSTSVATGSGAGASVTVSGPTQNPTQEGTTQSSAVQQASAAVSEPPSTAAPASALTAAQARGLHFSATADSWVNVRNANGDSVASRLLQPGKTLDVPLTGQTLLVTVGNANVTAVQVRGSAFDLSAHSRGNVARFEVK